MHSRAGYVSLTHLWRDFEVKFAAVSRLHALKCLEADPYSFDNVFGTGLDLCEDAFLKSFDSFLISLVPLRGAVVDVTPVLSYSGARLFEKCSAFESYHVSISQDQAGPRGQAMRQMGSAAFRPADLGWLCPNHRGRDTGVELEKAVYAQVFHTLPILFERSSFIIPRERPPWSYDLLEEDYVDQLWSETRGFSICLSQDLADKWKNAFTKHRVQSILNRLAPISAQNPIPEFPHKIGRPKKIDSVVQAYRDLGLKNKNMTIKAERTEIEEYLKMTFSVTILNRARAIVRGDQPSSTPEMD